MCGTCHNNSDPFYPQAAVLTECLDCHADSALPEVGVPAGDASMILVRYRESGLADDGVLLGQRRLEGELVELGYTPTDALEESAWLLEVDLEWQAVVPEGIYREAEIPVLLTADSRVTLRRRDGEPVFTDTPRQTLGFGRSDAAARSSALWTLTRRVSERLRVVLAGESLPPRATD